MAKKNKKHNTVEDMIENLARMTKEGFEEAEQKRDTMETRLNKRFDRIEFNMNTHERRIEILEDKMLVVGHKLGLRK